jgi:hypothetical protein
MEKDDTPHTLYTQLTWFTKEIKDFLWMIINVIVHVQA